MSAVLRLSLVLEISRVSPNPISANSSNKPTISHALECILEYGS